ncbi:MAG: hypothetical protein A2Z72_05050 [Omnitrophica bacterium RBG_13_46_9]|nr:MAG: hypothetical protein A2Z72_05050 [Omnitrophica bacterium RBG_13_46_9]
MGKKFVVMAIVIACVVLSGNVFAEGLKVGVLDFRKAGTECKKAKVFQEELNKKRDTTQKELDKMAEEMRKLKDEIDLMAEEAKEKKQQELREKTREFNEIRRTRGEELMMWRDDKMREIGKDIIDATNSFAEKNGYDLIIDQMAAVYSSKKYDISDEVLKELNK